MNVRLRVSEIISWYLEEVSMEGLWFEATNICIGSFSNEEWLNSRITLAKEVVFTQDQSMVNPRV